MGCRFSKVLSGARRLAAAAGLTAALVTASGGVLMAQSTESGSDNALVGAWLVEVTLRNCTTGAPLGPPVHSLVSFHRGGTLSESLGSGSFAIGQRSPGHGAWTQEQARMFNQNMVNLIVFDTAPNLPGTPGFNPSLPVSPGFFAGWQIVTHTIELSEADRFTSSGTNAFYKLDGTMYRTGCSTAAGRRFK